MNGILGGDMAAYDAYMQQQQQQQQQQQRQRLEMGQQYVANQGMGVQASRARTPTPRFNPNDSEAFQIPMSQLITMWRLKYGDSWHDGQKTSSEMMKGFYEAAFERLNRAQLFESFEGWYRLKEDA